VVAHSCHAVECAASKVRIDPAHSDYSHFQARTLIHLTLGF
jgi:hypothetical protein